MKIKKGQEKIYKDWKEKNSDCGYGSQVFDYAEAWAERMEKEKGMRKRIKKICETISYEVAEDFGLSAFQFGCAIQVLIRCWKYGRKLKPYLKRWR